MKPENLKAKLQLHFSLTKLHNHLLYSVSFYTQLEVIIQ